MKNRNFRVKLLFFLAHMAASLKVSSSLQSVAPLATNELSDSCVEGSVGWYGKRVWFTATRTLKSISSVYSISRDWNPRPRPFALVFEVVAETGRSCRFYKGVTGETGQWFFDGIFLFLHWDTGLHEKLEKITYPTTFFSDPSQQFTLEHPRSLDNTHTVWPLTASFVASKPQKVYVQVLMNSPKFNFKSCSNKSLIQWSLVTPLGSHQKDSSAILDTDILVFDLIPPTSKSFLKGIQEHKSGQILVGLSGECWKHPRYAHLKSANDAWDMDYRADWRFSADIPITLFSCVYFGSALQHMYKLPTFKARFKRIAVIISNCGATSGRNEVVEELIEHVPVDSYGACFNRAHTYRKNNNYDLSYKVIPQLSRYLFSIAMSSVQEVDYITEKVYIGLMAGTVPIILGAATQNWEDFLPCQNCAIPAYTFENVGLLAKHLKHLFENKASYMRYHAWRAKPYNSTVSRKFNFVQKNSIDTFSCRLSEAVRPGSCPPECLDIVREQSIQSCVAHASKQRFW
mmetsp:Transcript_37972/g.63854  ORF Transcript_37972/g.63854 Transcript_37972/m.63854 type:complete len:515 (+) Transcript_37972:153-1697(+)